MIVELIQRCREAQRAFFAATKRGNPAEALDAMRRREDLLDRELYKAPRTSEPLERAAREMRRLQKAWAKVRGEYLQAERTSTDPGRIRGLRQEQERLQTQCQNAEREVDDLLKAWKNPGLPL
jgi:hypothetical protein